MNRLSFHIIITQYMVFISDQHSHRNKPSDKDKRFPFQRNRLKRRLHSHHKVTMVTEGENNLNIGQQVALLWQKQN